MATVAPITRLTAPFGPEATEVLRAEIVRIKGDDPLAPISVAVPSNYAGLSLRRSLATQDTSGTGRPGIVNVRFVSLPRVAELLGAPLLAGAGRRPLSTAVRAEALRTALATAPGMFGDVATHHATERVLDRAFTELRACSRAALDALAQQSPRAAEVVRIFDLTWDQLANDWYDEHDVARAAVAAIENGAPALADVGHVIVFLPRRIAPSLQAMLDALGDRATVIDGNFDEDDLPHGTHIIGTGDPDEEVRAAVRGVMERVRTGSPLHRMAILLGADTPYALLAHQQLDAAAIPHNGPSVRTLAQTVAGITLLGLLDLPERGWRRDDVIAWLSAAPILGRVSEEDGRTHPVPATAWDAVSRAAGVVGTAEQWDERLDRYATTQADEVRRVLEEGVDDVSESRLRRMQLNVEQARELRAFMAEVVASVDAGERSTWRELSAWACGLLDRWLGSDLRHSRWPEDEQEAWRQVRAALERLGGLDAIARSRAVKPDAATFLRAAQRELEQPAGRIGKFGDGVFVGHLTAALGTDFDHVFIVGMAEGTLPGRARDDALLPDTERRATDGELALRADRLGEEHRDYLAALAAARRDLVLIWPRSDLRAGRVRLPSRWLLDTATALVGKTIYSDDLVRLAAAEPHDALEETDHRNGGLIPPDAGRAPTITAVASFEAGMRNAAEPASRHDYALGALARWQNEGGYASRHAFVSEDQQLARGFEAALSRRRAAFTRFDGNLPAGVVPVPGADEPVSPTSMETYAACPTKYLLGRVLRLAAEEKPEEVQRLSAMDKGTLVHRVLERYTLERLEGAEPARERLHEIAAEEFAHLEDKGLTGKPLFWEYDQQVIGRELDRFFEEDDLDPIAAELNFGLEPGSTPVPVTLDDGRTLAFRGSADRVDRGPDGSLVVTDYKTGGEWSYRSIEKDPVSRGTKLQLPIYGLAARAIHGQPDTPVESRYWFVSERGDFRKIGYALDDEKMGRFREVLGVITRGIAEGNFPAHPGVEDGRPGYGFENCGYCEFDKLCSSERGRQWDRKRTAPELASYVALTAGEPDPDAENGDAA